MKRGGLGRGLSSLIPGASEHQSVLELPVDEVRPNRRQPRTDFREEAIESLAASIREVGVLQPVIVRRVDGGYELVAGERRLRAARMAGLSSVPAIVRSGDDTDSLREAVIENLHREDLSPLELAAAFRQLLDDLGTTQEMLAERLGHSRAHVSNTMRLLSLPPDVQKLVREERLQAGHARALLGLPDDEARSALGLRVAAEELSVRQTEDLVRRYSQSVPSARRAKPGRTSPAPELEEALSDRLGTRVRITGGARRGRIVVEFGSAEDLDRIAGAVLGERHVDAVLAG